METTALHRWAYARDLSWGWAATGDLTLQAPSRLGGVARRTLGYVYLTDPLPPPVALLWALALELDERGATLTGERVCQACSGRGWVALWPDQPRHSVAFSVPCWCDGPTRPDTVALRDVVASLARMSRPVFAWPEPWIVLADIAQDAGDWKGRWWKAFREWTAGEPISDLTGLAQDLRDLTRPEKPRPAAFDTGRTSSPGPNIQQIPDSPWSGVRESPMVSVGGETFHAVRVTADLSAGTLEIVVDRTQQGAGWINHCYRRQQLTVESPSVTVAVTGERYAYSGLCRFLDLSHSWHDFGGWVTVRFEMVSQTERR